MKHSEIRILLLALLVGSLTAGAWAQEGDTEDESPSPVASSQASRPPPSPKPLRTLWDYQKPLGLTDTQIRDIKATLARFQGILNESHESITAAEAQLQNMIKNEAPMEQIRIRLQKIALMQADLRAEDVATSRRVNATMTPAQLEKWRRIQKTALGAAEANR